jgi:signal transduction histidine kinase
MIAHQWRQPITIIGIIANNTILDVELDEINSSKLLEDLESINYQVGYLSQTIDDFRNFFRPDKFHSNISTDELYTDLLSILGNSLEQHNIKIIVSGDTKERFNTYKNELVQVFLNIITNAKDAFIENKIADAKIYFTCEKQGEVMYFSIEDNAGGIPKEVLPKIFDPYFTTKALSHGTGIGLYMSYTIITNHLGGTVDVSSKDGKTTFMIQFPKLTLSDELTDASK